MSKRSWARAALSHSAFTGISRHHLGGLVAELAGPWHASRESDLRQRRGHQRCRAAGAGRRRELPFTGRVLVTLAVLRPLQRRIGRREDLPETVRAIGSLVSDRAAAW